MPWFMANFAYGGISKETLVILSILESWMWILARSPNFLLSSSISHFPFLPISIIPNFHSFQFQFLPIPIPPNSSSSQFSQSSLNSLFPSLLFSGSPGLRPRSVELEWMWILEKPFRSLFLLKVPIGSPLYVWSLHWIVSMQKYNRKFWILDMLDNG